MGPKPLLKQLQSVQHLVQKALIVSPVSMVLPKIGQIGSQSRMGLRPQGNSPTTDFTRAVGATNQQVVQPHICKTSRCSNLTKGEQPQNCASVAFSVGTASCEVRQDSRELGIHYPVLHFPTVWIDLQGFREWVSPHCGCFALTQELTDFANCDPRILEPSTQCRI